MLAKILGWFLIVIGVFFLLRPESLRNRIQKKSFKIIKKYLFLITVTLALFFIITGLKSQGMLSKLLLVVGIIGVVKGLFFLKAKAAERVYLWFLSRPIVFFRIAASCYVIFGIAILLLSS